MSRNVNRAMLEYFTEWKEINDNIEPAGDKDYAESLVDESEQASEFLASVGFANIVSTIKNGGDSREMYEDLETFLTKNQMATIRKRVDTLRRKGGNRTARKDVRSLFLDDRSHHYRETAQEVSKLHGIKFKRRISPFRSGGVANAEPELINSNTIAPHFANHDDDDDDDVDGHTALPVFFPDKALSICLERTLIDDLGKKDLKMLEALAQIELMGVFDKFKINFTKQKSKRKIKDKDGVFGIRLQTLLERDLKTDPTVTVPKLFHQLLCHMEKNCLNEEGILRLSGSFTRIKEIRREIDAQWYVDSKFSFEGLRPNDCSGLMKVFLRDLPAPLLTYEWIDSFVQISRIQNLVMQIYCLSLLMLLLPEVNRNTLKRLLSFLNKVVEHSDKNLMTEDNVTMIMAPNLFLVGSVDSSSSSVPSNSSTGGCTSDLDKDLLVATMSSNVILLMMRHLEEMFVVPPGLIDQIREKNRESKRKAVKKFFGKKEKTDNCRPPEKIQVNILLDSHCEDVSFKLKQDSTAKDVLMFCISQLRLHSESSPDEVVSNFSLHEVGGNIEERRLDPTSNLQSLLRVNPQAKFELRKKPSKLISTSTDV